MDEGKCPESASGNPVEYVSQDWVPTCTVQGNIHGAP
jgi:hypothetical protein